MPKFTLDFGERLFIAKPGVTTVDVKVDLYSDWKEAVLANDSIDLNQLGEAQAMRSIGGDPTGPTESFGAGFFLINNYRIRPQEANHELILDGDLFVDPVTNPIVVPTLGGFTVLTQIVRSTTPRILSSDQATIKLLDALHGGNVLITGANDEVVTVYDRTVGDGFTQVLAVINVTEEGLRKTRIS